MNRRERRAAGKRAKTDQSVLAASAPAALYETGLQHLRAGRHLDAQLACQQALATDPGHADSMHLMGLWRSAPNNLTTRSRGCRARSGKIHGATISRRLGSR